MGKKRVQQPKEEDDEVVESMEEIEAPKFTLATTSRKRGRTEEPEDDDEAAELEAEMAALRSMRTEHTGPAGPATYNKEGLLKCLEDWETASLPFLETMQIAEYQLQVENELDDLEREMSFYNHTLLAVAAGRKHLTQLNVPIMRPVDYFCEHVKSDAHMGRIKDRLLIEEKKISALEQRKLREENRKYNKQVSAKKKDDQVKEVKDTNKQIRETFRRSDRGDKGDSKDDKLEQILQGKSKKRKIMDSKYGFGDKSKKSKINDAKSSRDMKDFNPRGGKFVRNEHKGRHATAGKGAGKGGKKKTGNRPGKDTRQKSRSSRKST